MAITSCRKRKTFPELDTTELETSKARVVADTDEEASDDDSDEPEVITLTSGRAVADAQDNAIESHQKRLHEKKKAANKAREAFIQSTKSKSQLLPRANPSESDRPEDENSSTEDEAGSIDEMGGDPALLARMQRAMGDALDEDDQEDESGEEGAADDQDYTPPSTIRLPDSVFAAAAAEQQKPERKRKKMGKAQAAKGKRRRLREGPTERVIGGRVIRVMNAPDAPPPPPSRLSRKMATSTKGGLAFRRKWKQRDAIQAQIRSRSGPAQKFATPR